MKKLILTSFVSLLCGIGYAQNDIDAIRYSNKKFGSTAKSLSIGGAMGSLGADISSASVNPAGLAQFKKDEFSFSLGIVNAKNTGTFLNNQITDNTSKLFIPNLGLVFANKSQTKKGEKGWKNYTLGFNIARVADFNRILNFEGINTQTSLGDYFAERANGLSVDQVLGTDDDFDFGFTSKTVMAYEAYLFDSIGDKKYAGYASPIFHDIYQKNFTRQSGGMNEYNFSLAGNYNDMVYLGATISYTTVNFNETRTLSEINDPKNTAPNILDNFSYVEKLKTTGGGVSARLGMILKPSSFARIGLSIQTPQNWLLTDNYSFSINSTLRNGKFLDYKSKDGVYEYNLLSPGRYTVSATGIIGHYGFITADVEKVDYSAMRLRSDDGNPAMENANSEIRSKYQSSVNYRVGAELVLDEYRIRGGYANYGSPLKSGIEKDTRFITGGFGIKEKNWALDFALVHSLGEDVFQPYVLNDKSKVQPYAVNTFSSNTIAITLTTKF